MELFCKYSLKPKKTKTKSIDDSNVVCYFAKKFATLFIKIIETKNGECLCLDFWHQDVKNGLSLDKRRLGISEMHDMGFGDFGSGSVISIMAFPLPRDIY